MEKSKIVNSVRAMNCQNQLEAAVEYITGRAKGVLKKLKMDWVQNKLYKGPLPNEDCKIVSDDTGRTEVFNKYCVSIFGKKQSAAFIPYEDREAIFRLLISLRKKLDNLYLG